MKPRHRICLVSPSHLASNPRLVKEAAALCDAGYHVHVVSGRNHAITDRLDESVLAGAQWYTHRLNFRPNLRNKLARLQQLMALRRIRKKTTESVQVPEARSAHSATISRLATAARRIDADLYIGHTVAGLAAAAWAAQRTGRVFAFDAEDFHTGETDAILNDRAQLTAIQVLEKKLLPQAAYLTAAAPLIAEAYFNSYDLTAPPVTVLNVFPRAFSPAAQVAPIEDGVFRFYWFSQTIGPERGLEQVLEVLLHLNMPVELNLRGNPIDSFVDVLRARLTKSNKPDIKLKIHPPAPPNEMSRLAASYDLGIACELSTPPNHDICLANKIFTYLLAGLPYLYTPTSGQTAIAPEIGRAAIGIDPVKVASSARKLELWWGNVAERDAARETAWKLGQTRFNWDFEQQIFLKQVELSLVS